MPSDVLCSGPRAIARCRVSIRLSFQPHATTKSSASYSKISWFSASSEAYLVQFRVRSMTWPSSCRMTVEKDTRSVRPYSKSNGDRVMKCGLRCSISETMRPKRHRRATTLNRIDRPCGLCFATVELVLHARKRRQRYVFAAVGIPVCAWNAGRQCGRARAARTMRPFGSIEELARRPGLQALHLQRVLE